MDLKQLHYFMTIVTEQQITAAAKKLNMTQPPLSYQMKLLEKELGTQLFNRGSQYIELTEAGRLLARRAQQLLDMADNTIREIDELSQSLQGTLSIGTISSSGSILLSPGMQRFHREYQGVHFEIHDANTYQLIEELEKGIIEIGIVRTPFNTSPFNCQFLNTEPMAAVMTADLDWCPEQERITVAELDERPLIIYRRFQQLLQEVFDQKQIKPEIYCRNDDARTTVLWANAGLGIGIAPLSAVELAAHEHLHIKIIDEPALETHIAAVWRRNTNLSRIGKEFLTALCGLDLAADADTNQEGK
ncbi:LysR family transcriptional regulator [Selenomonas ruminantium]|uniref:Transcriptional regulator, LysR family n=1 Tax=Selenomonas ruminantium TaxID=971 RepID=A0A1H0U811_SELRU|nr:LysR family transcriptional regulator [Selenomonas ruminantium]SDP61966.1 transcriptional regulator, LysR family [Selenomonas ruminantium]